MIKNTEVCEIKFPKKSRIYNPEDFTYHGDFHFFLGVTVRLTLLEVATHLTSHLSQSTPILRLY